MSGRDGQHSRPSHRTARPSAEPPGSIPCASRSTDERLEAAGVVAGLPFRSGPNAPNHPLG